MYHQTWIEWAFEKNYLKRPDKDDETARPGILDYSDVFDRHSDAFKFFFIFLGILLIFYAISFVLATNMMQTDLLEDPVFLLYRGSLLIVGLFLIWFMYKWRAAIVRQN